MFKALLFTVCNVCLLSLLTVQAQPIEKPKIDTQETHSQHHHSHKPTHHHSHKPAHHHDFDPQKFAKIWEGPERIKKQRPNQVLKACGIEQHMTVVDLGTGTGFFLPYLSQAVGHQGKVIAVDVERKMIQWIQQRIVKEKLTNVSAKHVKPHHTHLTERSIDRILIVNVWHHIDQREQYLKHLSNILKREGKVCIVEIKPEAKRGPPKKHRLSPKDLKLELIQNTQVQIDKMVLKLEDQYMVTFSFKN